MSNGKVETAPSWFSARIWRALLNPFFCGESYSFFPVSIKTTSQNSDTGLLEGGAFPPSSAFGGRIFGGGDRFSITFNPNFIINDKLSVRIEYDFDDISLPQGQLTSHLVNSIFRYNLTNVWLTTTTLQYESTEDLYNLNFRLNYIYRPGDDVFLVFNRTSDNERTEWEVLLKMNHSFDF